MPHYLSKSDFKVARTCPAKLYYKKLGYPSSLDDNEYLEFLADGAYMVETIAKLLHPEGIEIGFEEGPEHSALKTIRALQAENVTLFEATLLSGIKLARVDVLRRNGNRFDLIEVKSKSVDGTEGPPFFRSGKGVIIAEWVPYLEDVAYQALLLRELFPKALITPFLCLVDISKTTDIESVFSRFELKRREVAPGRRFVRPEVRFLGDAEKLRQKHFLITVDVSAEVNELMPVVLENADRFAESLNEQLMKISAPIGVNCLKCEYRNDAVAADARDGFRECWGQLADEAPHILDYYRASSIGGLNTPLVNSLVRRGRAKLSDVEEVDLVKSDGTIGARAERQRIQREYTLLGQEYLSHELSGVLAGVAYPLHFIDFETSRLAVPYHAGMRPYQQTAFQWSCHTIPEKGALPFHTEWINLRDAYPNFLGQPASISRALERSNAAGFSQREFIVEAINRCYCPAASVEHRSKLYLWVGHRYHEQPSRAFVAQAFFHTTDFDVLLPRLPKRIEAAFHYLPDHFILKLRKHGERYRLVVDFPLFETLRKVQKGLPRHLLPERDLNRLDSFLTQLHEAQPQRTSEFLVYNQETLTTSRIEVSEDQAQYIRATLAI